MQIDIKSTQSLYLFPVLTIADVPVRHRDAYVVRLAPHAFLAPPARAHLPALVRPASETINATIADLIE